MGTAELANLYYGTALAPRWPHGAAWVAGRALVQFIGENAPDLKVRGMPNLLVGFWLAGLEDVHFVNFQPGVFHDLLASDKGGAPPSCPGNLAVAFPMNSERWEQMF